MDESGLSSLMAVLVLIVANALLTLGYEALVNTRKPRLAELAEQGNRRAAAALRLGQDATNLLITYQLSVMVLRFFAAGVAAVGIAPPVALWLTSIQVQPDAAFALAEVGVLLAAAALMMVLGEQIPAAVAAARAERLALISARPMGLLVRLLTPLCQAMRQISEWLVRLLGGKETVHYVTEEEIKTLVDAGQEEGVIEDEEKEMIYSIFDLGDTATREVMVPRLDVVALEINTPLDEAVRTVIEAGHSRIPVYEGTIDHVRGLLYAKDLLKLWDRDARNGALRDLLREAFFVPEGKRAMDLLQEMQRRRVHVAVVVDEYGGMAGLVTLEDLIEEITGEIQDEYDQHEEALYQRISDDEYLCNARLDLDDLNDLMDISLPTDESDTLGGFILSQVGEVPQPGTVIETDDVRLDVLTVDERRIGQVRVTRVRLGETPAAVRVDDEEAE